MAKKKKDKLIKHNNKNKKLSIIKGLFYVRNKFQFMTLFKNILIPLVGGVIIFLITRNSMLKYETLKKPVFAPPSYIFPVVWIILYIVMGVSAYRIYINNKEGKDDKGAYFIYLIQLCLNFLWAIIFFNLRLYGMSFILGLLLVIMMLLTSTKFYKVDKLAGILFIPNIIWITFASLLTYFIWKFNEM